MQEASNETSWVRAFSLDQRLPLGFRFPTTCHALALSKGEFALVSAVPFSEETRRSFGGQVPFLVAPNHLHHLYLNVARASFPEAELLAPGGLLKKRPDLKLDHRLEAGLPAELREHLSVIPIEGCPELSEWVIYHHASQSLIVTDLFFHLLEPVGVAAHLILSMVGAHKKLAQSRAISLLVKDRTAYFRSIDRVLELKPKAICFAHGAPVLEAATERLQDAVRRSLFFGK